jgi:hypothetical protein
MTIQSSIAPPAWVIRRAQFVCNEACFPDQEHDQTVKYALRVISNFATVGKDATSSQVKELNPRVSKQAFSRLKELLSDDIDADFLKWCSETINEHPEPLGQIWGWISNSEVKIPPEELIERLASYKMITILRTENARIDAAGGRSRGSPADRRSQIELSQIGMCPKRWIAENRNRFR